jgi:hypothetical protein
MPPKRGVGSVWSFREAGRSSTSRKDARRITRGVRPKEISPDITRM